MNLIPMDAYISPWEEIGLIVFSPIGFLLALVLMIAIIAVVVVVRRVRLKEIRSIQDKSTAPSDTPENKDSAP